MKEYAQTLESIPKTADHQKLSVGINENSILLEYQEFCITKKFANQVSTTAKGETSQKYFIPSHHCLIADCKMKPSSSLYYRVKDLHFDNMVVFLTKWHELFLMTSELEIIKSLNKLYCKMIKDVLQSRFVDFSSLKLQRLDYAKQTKISDKRVDLATACSIHYGLNMGMVI
jgi:hypothetical protein